MPQNLPKKVLIAQLNSVRSYRVRFFELLEERRPDTWEFQVVHDCDPERAKRLYPVYLDPNAFAFPILQVKTIFLSRKNPGIVWQTFFQRARHYDLVITDTVVSNLTYFFVNLWQVVGVRRGLWGHSGNLIEEMERRSRFTRRILATQKAWAFRHADMIFAYTETEKERFEELGVPADRIVTLNNTIDIKRERQAFEALQKRRAELREKYDLSGREVIVYLGRIMEQKFLDRLVETFYVLRDLRPQALLLLVGDGPARQQLEQLAAPVGPQNIRFMGAVGENVAQELLTASDLFCLPGQVGLAPLRALCFDLPVVAFQHAENTPEFEYLNPSNATLLPPNISPREFAVALSQALDDWKTPKRRLQVFSSIAHLTMENMVDNFIKGVNIALGIQER